MSTHFVYPKDKELLTCRESIGTLDFEVSEDMEASVFKERWWLSTAGSRHSKTERLHSSYISGTIYNLLRTNGLGGCIDRIGQIYLSDGGTYEEWANMNFGEKCEWIQAYTT